MDESLIIEIWDTFKDYIPEKNRDAAATQYVDFLVSNDVDAPVLEGLLGYDPHLDEAIGIVLDEYNDEAEQDEEEEDLDDDEDY
jgi:hypothetical protein